MKRRKNLKETWEYLEKEGWKVLKDEKGKLFVPDKMPSYDDEEPLGFSFFKQGLEEADLSNLTIPKTFFGRSRLIRVNFSNTDLRESRICWNDFIECNFTSADLSCCDLRATVFINCNFSKANVQNADLRHSTFERCKFTNTIFDNSIIQKTYSLNSFAFLLSTEQKCNIKWVKFPGSLPEGG